MKVRGKKLKGETAEGEGFAFYFPHDAQSHCGAY